MSKGTTKDVKPASAQSRAGVPPFEGERNAGDPLPISDEVLAEQTRYASLGAEILDQLDLLPKGYITNRVEVRLSPPAAEALSRLRAGLNENGVRMSNGRYVQDHAHVVIWLLERIAAAAGSGAVLLALLLLGAADLRADENPWRQYIAVRAAKPDAYADIGQWDAVQFQITGKVEHAKAAVAQALANWPTTYDERGNLIRNNTREHAAELAILYEILKPHMTEDQHAIYEHTLRLWAEEMLTNTRDGDSDEVVGHYMGLRLIDRALGTDYCLRPPQKPSASALEMREALRDFVERARLAPPGAGWDETFEWPENGEKYNYGTQSLWLMGVSALGPAEFPEAVEVLPALAEQMTWHITADGKDSVQWGDVEDPHEAALYKFVTLAGQVIALGGDKTGNLKNLVASRIKGRPVEDYGFTVYRTFWAGFDSATLPTNPVWPNPQGLRVSKIGLVLHRKGGTLAQVYAPSDRDLDHRIDGTNLRLYDGGRWLLDSPMGYGNARPLNQALAFGFGAMSARKLESWSETADGFKSRWTTGGVLRGSWAGNNQPNWPTGFVDEMATETEYIHATRRFHIVDTFKGRLPDLAATGGPALNDAERQTILGAPARWQRVQHMPTEPTPTADGYRWTTKGGTLMELKTTATTRVVEKCSGVNMRGDFHPEELIGWLVRLMDDTLPSARIETWIGPVATVGPPPDQPPPPPPPVDPQPQVPGAFPRTRVELRPITPKKFERVEVFEIAP